MGIYKIANGMPISIASLAERRLLFLLPSAVLAYFSNNMFTIIFPMQLYYLGLVVTAYYCGKNIADRYFGASAALLVAFHPLIYFYSGSLLPDTNSAFYCGLALFAVFKLIDKIDSETKSAFIFSFLTGLFIGLATAIKESGIVIVILFPCLMLLYYKKIALRRLVTFVFIYSLGFISWFLIEPLFFYLFAGEMHSSLINVTTPHGNFKRMMNWQGKYPLKRIQYLLNTLNLYSVVYFCLSIGSLFVLNRLLNQERKKFIAALLFFIWPFMFFTFGTVSLREYIAPVIQPRYYALCILPGALLLVFLGRHILSSVIRHSKIANVILMSCIMLASLAVMSTHYHKRAEIYRAEVKYSMVAALAQIKDKFPDLPIIPMPASTSNKPIPMDIYRCVRLMVEFPQLSHDLLHHNIMNTDAIDAITGPYILVGPGGFWETGTHHLIAELERKIKNKNQQVIKLDSYYYTKASINALPEINKHIPPAFAEVASIFAGASTGDVVENNTSPHAIDTYLIKGY